MWKPGRTNEKRLLICGAIRAMNRVQFSYLGNYVEAEPYCYGRLNDGKAALLCYEVGTSPAHGWRLYRGQDMADLASSFRPFDPRPPEDTEEYHARSQAIVETYCAVFPGQNPDIGVIHPPPNSSSIRMTHNRLMRLFRRRHV